MESIKLGVLGLGKMGRHHLRCAGLASGVELTAAGDVEGERASLVPDGIPFSTDLDELLARVDAVVVATPTESHARIGRHILEAGKHLLLEKPFAVTESECDELEAVADRAGCVLRIGHVERMNGAYLGLRDRIKTPRFIEGHRLAGFDPRGTDVDVVLDLMIHDLDLVLDLHRREPVRVEAIGVSVLTDRVDIANARLEFPGGELVNLTASRVSREPVRKLRVFQEDAYLSLDFQKQCAEIFGRNDAAPMGIHHEKVDGPEGHNPLVEEIQGFAAAVRGEDSAVATAEDGRRAVALAARIRESMERRASRFAESAGGAPWHAAPS